MCGSRILKMGIQSFTDGFHADIAAVLCEKPVAQGGDIWIGGVESFCLVRGRQSNGVRSTDSRDN